MLAALQEQAPTASTTMPLCYCQPVMHTLLCFLGCRYGGGGGGPPHKRPRGERRAGGGGSSRLRRVASRGQLGGRYMEADEDDVPDRPASPWRALQVRRVKCKHIPVGRTGWLMQRKPAFYW